MAKKNPIKSANSKPSVQSSGSNKDKHSDFETTSLTDNHFEAAGQIPGRPEGGSFNYGIIVQLSPFIQALILVLVTILVYANTMGHKYAVDDYVVIVENDFTQKGFAGIFDHLTQDSFTGYFKTNKDLLSGGRYRPLSLITFAIEYQFFKKSPEISHVINVLFYGLLIFVLWKFLSEQIFRSRKDIAFWITLLFAVHPIHTEVVANIKGRDEILSMLLLIYSTMKYFEYLRSKSRNILLVVVSLFTFFLALLAKENGFTWIVIFPITLYCFTRLSTGKILTHTLGYVATLVLYFIVRTSLTGGVFTGKGSTDIMNNPYVLVQNIGEKYATIIFILGKYLKLLFLPYPLSWDYSYNQIPYTNFTNPITLVSLIVLTGILGYGFYRLPKRDPVAYGILFYYFSVFISSNILVNIGAFMAERFLFQASLGFCIVLGILIIKSEYLFSKIGLQKSLVNKIVTSVIVVLILIWGVMTFQRNFIWYSNETLYIHDTKTVPNSAKALLAAGEAETHLANDSTLGIPANERPKHYQIALDYFNKALKIYPDYNDAHLRIVLVHLLTKNYDLAEPALLKAATLYPENNKLIQYQDIIGNDYFNKGVDARKKCFEIAGKKGIDLAGSLAPFEKIKVEAPDAAIKYEEAINWIKRASKINPKNPEPYNELGNLYGFKGDFKNSFSNFQQAIALSPSKHSYHYNLGIAYRSANMITEAIASFKRCYDLQPGSDLGKESLNLIESLKGNKPAK